MRTADSYEAGHRTYQSPQAPDRVFICVDGTSPKREERETISLKTKKITAPKGSPAPAVLRGGSVWGSVK